MEPRGDGGGFAGGDARGSPGCSRPEPIEALVGGALEETEHGPVLTVRREYALDHRHGEAVLGGAFAAAPALLGMLTRHGVPAGGAGRLLFLDTETTGLAGGARAPPLPGGAAPAGGRPVAVPRVLARGRKRGAGPPPPPGP